MHVYIHYMCNYIEKDTSRSIPLSLVKLKIGIIFGTSGNPLGLELCKRQTISILPPEPFQQIAVFMSLAKTNLRALRLTANEAWTAGRLVYVTICKLLLLHVSRNKTIEDGGRTALT